MKIIQSRGKRLTWPVNEMLHEVPELSGRYQYVNYWVTFYYRLKKVNERRRRLQNGYFAITLIYLWKSNSFDRSDIIFWFKESTSESIALHSFVTNKPYTYNETLSRRGTGTIKAQNFAYFFYPAIHKQWMYSRRNYYEPKSYVMMVSTMQSERSESLTR